MQPKIAKASEEGYIDVLDGIKRKTLVYGEKTLFTEAIEVFSPVREDYLQ